MALKPIVGEIKSQDLNDNFSYLDERIVEGGTDPQLEADVATLAGGSMVAKADRSAFNAHLAETVSETLVATRDMSLAGTQTIATQKKAKAINIVAVKQDNTSKSWGFWSPSSQYSYASQADNVASIATNAIRIGASGAERISGIISNVTNTGFNIDWTKTGNPTGTLNIIMQVDYHGE